LAQIYEQRGLKKETALIVAQELTAHNALGIHLIEELGITESTRARPFQAAWSSMASFAIGAALPLLAATFALDGARILTTLFVSVIALIALGYAGARAGGAAPLRPMLRVVGGGIVAMAATMAIGKLFGTVIG
jgi:VIT1/CCC1 family predicted Fe2+/Mn2+ transporter